ncbi:hypothetical protein BASA81_005110 [Batrachochytrium salamandrivorans]|nr:hypothetical protein BASA81_005110 [Batrachochytrium salamandrivorans]
MAKHVEALQYLLGLQTKVTDIITLKQQLDKPFLVDNVTGPLQSMAQLKRNAERRTLAIKLARRAPRRERRTKFQPLKSQALHDELFECWLNHNQDNSTIAGMSSSQTTSLLGCRLTVVSCRGRVLGKNPVTGVVIRETDTVVHLSSLAKVHCIPKRGTVFGFRDEFEFQRQ